MLVGLGGNNGSTLTAGILANKARHGLACLGTSPEWRGYTLGRRRWPDERRIAAPTVRAAAEEAGAAPAPAPGLRRHSHWRRANDDDEGRSSCPRCLHPPPLPPPTPSFPALPQHGLSWMTKDGPKRPNFHGSLTQASTVRLGNFKGEEVHAPFSSLLPMVNPTDIVVGGWDISKMDLAAAMERSKVLDWELQRQLVPLMRGTVPLPAAFDQNFVAANQADRADNLIPGTKADQVAQIRKDIREFKQKNGLDKVVVLWTANTERFAEVRTGLNDTADNLLASLEKNEAEIAPSQLYGIACCQENVPYINGAPQNTFVPGLIELAERTSTLIGGDDFKSGQTKMKSVLVDFLVGAGIKPVSIVSYNHLGNNDGLNLSAPQTFRSKEISKSNVVDDMVDSNKILYKAGEHPDHLVVIKYLPYVGDSKRAMDEYTSEIFMGGKNTITMHNVCEDSLLAAPLILDLVLLAELITRIELLRDGEKAFHGFHPIAVLLSYLTKAPLVPKDKPVVNALAKQRAMLENTLRACIGLAPDNNMQLEHK